MSDTTTSTPAPSAAAPSRAAVVQTAAIAGLLGWAYLPMLRVFFDKWVNDPQYSHGFLVPLFSAYLVYRWRPEAPRTVRWPEPWGLAVLAAGMGLFVAAGVTNVGKEWVQGLSLVVASLSEGSSAAPSIAGMWKSTITSSAHGVIFTADSGSVVTRTV